MLIFVGSFPFGGSFFHFQMPLTFVPMIIVQTSICRSTSIDGILWCFFVSILFYVLIVFCFLLRYIRYDPMISLINDASNICSYACHINTYLQSQVKSIHGGGVIFCRHPIPMSDCFCFLLRHIWSDISISYQHWILWHGMKQWLTNLHWKMKYNQSWPAPFVGGDSGFCHCWRQIHLLEEAALDIRGGSSFDCCMRKLHSLEVVAV